MDKKVKEFIEFVRRNVGVPSEVNETEQWGNDLLSKQRKGRLIKRNIYLVELLDKDNYHFYFRSYEKAYDFFKNGFDKKDVSRSLQKVTLKNYFERESENENGINRQRCFITWRDFSWCNCKRS